MDIEKLKQKLEKPQSEDFDILYAKDIKKTDLLPLRGEEEYGFRDYYLYRTNIDETLQTRTNLGQHSIVIGKPLSGKTRAVYQMLHLWFRDKNPIILIPKYGKVNPRTFKIPKIGFRQPLKASGYFRITRRAALSI